MLFYSHEGFLVPFRKFLGLSLCQNDADAANFQGMGQLVEELTALHEYIVPQDGVQRRKKVRPEGPGTQLPAFALRF